MKYKIRYFQEAIYTCEYLTDGLSFSSLKNRVHSPGYATLLYCELSKSDISFIFKIRALINYWRFAFYRKDSFLRKIHEIGVMSIILLPIAFLFLARDCWALSSKIK
jgi:hypothetical protein